VTTKAERAAAELRQRMTEFAQTCPEALALALCHTQEAHIIAVRLANLGTEHPDLAEPALLLLADDPRRAVWQPARLGLAKLGSKTQP
jgi:hypothetical protein